jgi:hypothetical protein
MKIYGYFIEGDKLIKKCFDVFNISEGDYYGKYLIKFNRDGFLLLQDLSDTEILFCSFKELNQFQEMKVFDCLKGNQ